MLIQKIQIVIVFLLLSQAYASSKFINISIHPWLSTCEITDDQKNCKTPTPFAEPFRSLIEIKEVFDQGSADMSLSTFKNDELSGKIKAFSIFPHHTSSFPPYVQFQIIIEKPIYLMCSHSISVDNLSQAPPLLCSANFDDNRFGMTITFGALHN